MQTQHVPSCWSRRDECDTWNSASARDTAEGFRENQNSCYDLSLVQGKDKASFSSVLHDWNVHTIL